MKAIVCSVLGLGMLMGFGCSSGGGKSTPGGGGNIGTAGSMGGAGAAGTGGDGAPGGSGGGTPDAASGAGGGGSPDAAPDAPMEPGIIIQEDQPGFSAVDGKIYPRQGSTSITGFTGTGFADGDPGMGKTIAWSVKAETAGTYRLVWRYAFGGAAANTRDAKLAINGVTVADTVTCAYTTDWTNWQQTPALEVQLAAGSNFIQLAALGATASPTSTTSRSSARG